MAEAIRLGRMTDTMEEGFIAELSIKVGDTIKSGDTIAEIETDKATLPLESYFTGTILHLAVKQGDTLKIGDLIAVIGKEGEDFSALLKANTTVTENIKSETLNPKSEIKNQKSEILKSASSASDRIKASPLAKNLAHQKGIDLSQIHGSGDDGRIIRRDLENAMSAAAAASKVEGEYRDERVSQMRKTIAKRLTESKNTAPHFYLTIDINMDNAVAFRKKFMEDTQQKISFNDIVIKASALALKEHPHVNSTWLGDSIRYYDSVHVGVAVAVDEGLLVPVIKNADAKTLQQISSEVKSFAEKATSKKLLPQEMEGNTFTISNLGMFGVEEFTAIINPPASCILAVGAIRQEVGIVNGGIKPVNKMKVTLSCDHRVVDGATGAKFLQTLKNVLENSEGLV